MVAAERLAEALRDADYLMGIIGPLDDATLAAARRLRLVQLLSVGYDRFNLAGARVARVSVAVNGGANAIAVAEHAILLMMATLRHLTDLDAGVARGTLGLSTPNTVLTPHVAGPTWQSWPRRFGNGYLNITRVERGERPQWVIPELADLFR